MLAISTHGEAGKVHEHLQHPWSQKFVTLGLSGKGVFKDQEFQNNESITPSKKGLKPSRETLNQTKRGPPELRDLCGKAGSIPCCCPGQLECGFTSGSSLDERGDPGFMDE
jgi:hypothetical protein